MARTRRLLLGLALPAALAACGTAPIVAVKPGFDQGKVGRVALVGFGDYPGAPGSGQVAAEAFEPLLLQAGYDLVERQQIEKIMSEQSLSLSAAIDPDTAKRDGQLLGADALAVGNVTSAAQGTEQTIMTTVTQVSQGPTSQSQMRVGRRDWVTTQTPGDVTTTQQQIPQTYTTPSVMAFTIRLVSVRTGEVLWIGSCSGSGDSLQEAATQAAQKIVKALRKATPR